MAGIPGFSSGGDMAFDTGAGGNDSLQTGSKTAGGNNAGAKINDSVNNVNFQFMPNSTGSNALDFATGFFRNSQPESNSVDKKWLWVGAGVGVLLFGGVVLLLKGRK